MQRRRAGYSSVALARRSSQLAARLLDSRVVAEARRVALFWPMEGKGEVDLRVVDEVLRARGGVELFYPFMDAKKGGGLCTGFRRARAIGDLKDRGRGFLEPLPAEEEAVRGDLDLIFVPALLADPRGHRIGYGAGYYDLTLKEHCPPAQCWLTVFQFQLASQLPTEGHDWACDAVMTDETFHLTS